MSIQSNSRSSTVNWEVHTVVDVHVWPDVLTLADHARLAPRESGFDEARGLDRVRVLYSIVDEWSRGETPDCAWKDDMRADIAWQLKTEGRQQCRQNVK